MHLNSCRLPWINGPINVATVVDILLQCYFYRQYLHLQLNPNIAALILNKKKIKVSKISQFHLINLHIKIVTYLPTNNNNCRIRFGLVLNKQKV